MPRLCSTLIRPNAVPIRRGSTSMAVEGQITAGITEKAAPISAVEIHRLQWEKAQDGEGHRGISAAPMVSSIARQPEAVWRAGRTPASRRWR